MNKNTREEWSKILSFGHSVFSVSVHWENIPFHLYGNCDEWNKSFPSSVAAAAIRERKLWSLKGKV